MEDLKEQESTVDSTELTGEQLDAVCGGLRVAGDGGSPNIYSAAAANADLLGAAISVGTAIVNAGAAAVNTVVNSL